MLENENGTLLNVIKYFMTHEHFVFLECTPADAGTQDRHVIQELIIKLPPIDPYVL